MAAPLSPETRATRRYGFLSAGQQTMRPHCHVLAGRLWSPPISKKLALSLTYGRGIFSENFEKARGWVYGSCWRDGNKKPIQTDYVAIFCFELAYSGDKLESVSKNVFKMGNETGRASEQKLNPAHIMSPSPFLEPGAVSGLEIWGTNTQRNGPISASRLSKHSTSSISPK